MKSTGIAVSVSLLGVAACVTADGDPGNGEVATKDMPAYCDQKASAAFGVEPRDVAVSPIDTSGGIYTLHGQTPPKGDDVQTFQCQFDPNGVFITVVPTVRRG